MYKCEKEIEKALAEVPTNQLRPVVDELVKGDKQVGSTKKMDRIELMSYIVATASFITNKKFTTSTFLKDINQKYKLTNFKG